MMLPLFRLLAVTSLLVLGAAASIAQTPAVAPSHVGSRSCADCHESEEQAWMSSHHSWAWTKPDETTILGDFDDAVFVHKGVTTRFTRQGGSFSVETEGSDGALHTFPVVGVVGVAPLQQYLVATQAGRLQALDVVWDVEGKRWYHLYPDQNLAPGDGLHWTGPYKNWNARCAVCHATGYNKNYDPIARSYASDQAEIGVGCEACHGPAEAHMAWVRSPATFDANQWIGVGAHGLTVAFDAGAAEFEIELCAGCHSRREPLGASSPAPESRYADSYRLALMRDGLYHPDGQVLDEVYVYGSFLQSKMYARGVRCSNCHDPHSAQLVAKGNAVCTQCHNRAGNPEFPTLKRALYDAPTHHFHDPAGPGAQCVDCHMPGRFYMILDARLDHSFRIPRPDLSGKLGTPNACTACHSDKAPAWAAARIESWYPAGRGKASHYGTVFSAARQGVDDGVKRQLLALAMNDALPAIVRATALSLLRSAQSFDVAEVTAPLLEAEHSLIRAAAIPLQRGAPAPTRMQRMLPLFADPLRSVRIEAARLFLDMPVVALPKDIEKTVEAAMSEYRASLFAKADFPEIQMAIGGTALVLRNTVFAERAFSEAVAMDPQLTDAWLILARLQTVRGDLAGAEASLLRGVAAVPDNGVLHQSLGNVLVLAGKGRAAVAPLEEAVRLMPDDATALVDLGAQLSRLGDHARAIAVLKSVDGIRQGSPELLFTLATSQLASGAWDAAKRTTMMLERLFPDSPLAAEARRLLAD